VSLVISPNKQQALTAKHQLTLLQLPPGKRVRVLKTLGRYERKLARQRIRQQRTVDGQKFTPRKDGRKAKLLRQMGRTLEPYVINGQRLELKHKNRLTGRIAAFQQEGGQEQMTAAKLKKRRGEPDYDAPCTREQAKALVSQGFRVRRSKGKGYKRATIKHIQASLTLGQAGLILRMMRNQKLKQRWIVPVDGRPFLGDTPQNVQRKLADILDEISH